MSNENILAVLLAEREKLNRAIEALGGPKRRGRPPGPRAVASALIDAEHAIVAHENGKVRSIRLIASASTHALRIGGPIGECKGVRFAVREKLDSGHVVWRHHRCSTDVLE